MFYNPPIHVALGLSALLIGLLLALGAPSTAAEAAHIGGLRSLSAAQLAAATPGQEVLLEGRISPDAAPIYRDFVAYAREEYRSGLFGSSDHWIESERVTPPFAILVSDGGIIILNSDYDFPTVQDQFREAEPTATRGAVRTRGLKVAAQVFVTGTVAEGGRGLNAVRIYPGSRTGYLAKAGRWSRAELGIGLAAITIGAAELALGGWQLRRFLREISTAPDA